MNSEAYTRHTPQVVSMFHSALMVLRLLAHTFFDAFIWGDVIVCSMTFKNLHYCVYILAVAITFIGPYGCHQTQSILASDSDSQPSLDTGSDTTTDQTDFDTNTSTSDISTDSTTGEDTNIETDTFEDTATDSPPPCIAVQPALCAQRSDCYAVTAAPVDSANACYKAAEPVECLNEIPPHFTSRAIAIDDNGQCWIFPYLYVPTKMMNITGMSFTDTDGFHSEQSYQEARCGVWINNAMPCQ